MTLEKTVEKSPADAALDKGKVQVGSKTRKVVKAKRSTDAEKLAQKRQEAIRKRDSDIFQASLKKKNDAVVAEEDDESDWESVEEDYPGVKLSELLDGLTLEVNNDDDDEDQEINNESAAGVQTSEKQVKFAAAGREEEKKQ